MKKFLSLAACLTVIASLAIGGTVAYLTDTDSDVNVMTLGNVKIEQIELERIDPSESAASNKDNFQTYTQGKMLLPATGTDENGNIPYAVDENGNDVMQQLPYGGGMQLWDDDGGNVMDKLVFVKNTGNVGAYVRTLIAYEGKSVGGGKDDLIHPCYNGTFWDATTIGTINVKGVTYTVTEYVYKRDDGAGEGVLKAGETTRPSLLQLYMASWADNEDVAQFGNTYDILVLSQAVQAQGFDDAKTALDAGFGAVTTDTAAEWFGGISVPTTVSTENELTDALADGGSAILTSDIQPTGAIYVTGGTLYGNGNTIDASQVTTSAWPNAYAVTLGNGGSAVDNLKIINAGYAIGSTATTEDIYINNVTIDKVTYAINGNGNNKNSVYVTNSTINGWISYSNVKLLSFDNCKLAKGESYDGYLVVYGDTSFNNCEFKDFHMCAREQDGKVVAAGDTVSFTNCTYNGEKITAANFKNLFMKTGDDADFNNLKECNVVIDGVKVTW